MAKVESEISRLFIQGVAFNIFISEVEFNCIFVTTTQLFFSAENNIFLSQQISQQCFSAGLSAQPNGPILFLAIDRVVFRLGPNKNVC
jgi:hypothetical protein